MAAIPVCVKTPKGIEEVEKRTQRLAMRARQILIMIDGKRDYETLLAMFPGDATPALCEQLLTDGFITPLRRPEPVAPASPAPPVPAARPTVAPAPADDAERLAMARNFMMNTLNAFVGIAASSLISRIEACPELDELRHRFGDWKDAMALTGDGRKRLGELEVKLAALLS